MPTRGIVAGLLTVVGLVLLLSFKTPSDPISASSTPRATSSAGTTGSAGASAGATATTPPGTGTPASQSGTFQGQAYDTPYGPVQVQITVSNGKITDVTALQNPTGRQSNQINAYAIPILRQEALQAQNANINFISGATWTSQGYTQSLQSAIDQAGI